MLEGVVHNGLEHQAVPNLGWATEVEHLNGLQRRVGTTQPAGGGQGLGGNGINTPSASATVLSHSPSQPSFPDPAKTTRTALWHTYSHPTQ